jgi:hypothetical protein
MSDLPIPSAFQGQAWLETAGNDINALDFVIRMILSGDVQAELVRVDAVHGGGVGSPATVDVQPMVNQQSGPGIQTPHGIVYGLPCRRIQGGIAAVIVDPIVGDIGLAVYCDRDISTVKATGAVSPPGSWRQRSRSDGVYICGLLGSAPTNYVQITQTGINLSDVNGNQIIMGPTGITITSAGTININGAALDLTGTATIDGKGWLAHEHTGVQFGSSNTGPVA